MLKKLKHKFILISMLLIGIVLFSVFTTICIITYRTEEATIKTALEKSLYMSEIDEKSPIISDIINSKIIPIAYVFTADVKINGTIVCNNSDVDKKTVETAVYEAMSSKKESGIIKSLKLSFMKKELSSGDTVIAFVTRENLHQRTTSTILMSLIASAVSMLLFYSISKHLVEIALEPAYKVWNQQKQFIADASHDLKTPITVILANNNIIASHKDDPVSSQMQWIESTGEEAERMSDLVNKMLELAKSEDLIDRFDLEEKNISEICEETILQFEVVAFEKNISVESSIEPDIKHKTNSETLSKILRILFENAVKYSPEGEKITIKLSSSPNVCLSINNKGDVISPEDMKHIFERFYRASKAREVGGYGLGLSIAQNLAQAINSRIEVSSNENDGTTFSLIFKK